MNDLELAGLVVVAVVLFGAAGVGLLSWAACRQYQRQYHPQASYSRPARVTTVPVPDVTRGPALDMDALALVCGICTGVPGAWRCACSGHCGAQRCQGGAVIYDLASALQRIQQEGRRG